VTGIRIAIYLAYLIFIVFAVTVIVASAWLVMQGVDLALALITEPPSDIALAMEPSAEATAVPQTAALVPTAEPTPTPTPAPTTEPSCIASAQAAQYRGETRCVQGTVVHTYATATAFFVEFDQPGVGFFGSVLNPRAALANLKGKCVQLKGKIQEYKGRPFIIFQADQAQTCPNP
jgi:hypothetical protein